MDWLASHLSFAGRAKRRDYLGFTLLMFTLLGAGFAIYEGLEAAFGSGIPTAVAIFGIVVGAIVFIYMIFASVGVTVRRLHDMNLSGWFYFLVMALSYVPYIGWLAGIAWLGFVPGTEGANRFGADPRDPGNAALLDVFEGEAITSVSVDPQRTQPLV